VGPDAELWLSPISIWETLLLGRTRRLNLQPDPLRFVLDALKRAPFASVPVTREIALRTHDLEGFSTDDPADRLLVATALEHDLTLVTADAAMRAYAPVKTLW
jgi:PIN domain nuclease of toxin-antitoxin system